MADSHQGPSLPSHARPLELEVQQPVHTQRILGSPAGPPTPVSLFRIFDAINSKPEETFPQSLSIVPVA